METNLFNLNHEDMAQFFTELGEKPFRATQLLKWMHQQGVLDFSHMTNLSKLLRQSLQEKAHISLPQVVTEQQSQDGTRKWVLQLADHNYIETVLIPEEGRNTLCISSQVGCILNCPFCATGKQGFNRNLTTAEIIAQLWIAEHSLRDDSYRNGQHVINNVVLMGMGEPLANYQNVVKAIDLMMDDNTYGLSWRRVTLSTSGLIPAILRLAERCPVNLAISLHAPDDKLRDQLVPINQKYPLAELMAACRSYVKADMRRKITVEYIMLKGVNDSPSQAKALAKLLQGIPAKVNLIPFNAFAGSDYRCPSLETIDQFRNILMKAGFITVTRKSRGQDIDAACGQLVGKVKARQPLHAIKCN